MGRENNLINWTRLNGFTSQWVAKESISSPDWCDANSWPLGTTDSTWKVTAQSVTGRDNDDRIVVMTKAIVTFCGAIIHDEGGMSVDYYVGDTEVESTLYSSRKDFEKRATKVSIQNASDEKSGVIGDVWRFEMDFLEESTPLILWPISMGAADDDPVKLTSFSLKIGDDKAYKAKVEPNGEYAFVRYPDIRIFELPLTDEELQAQRDAKPEIIK
ncbi:MAG: hypothetical protein GY841_15470 [FCB group bacterium]|nr:hypothetical protein [FCB group bacterium]